MLWNDLCSCGLCPVHGVCAQPVLFTWFVPCACGLCPACVVHVVCGQPVLFVWFMANLCCSCGLCPTCVVHAQPVSCPTCVVHVICAQPLSLRTEKEYLSTRRQLSGEVEEKKTVIGSLSKELEVHQKNFNELKTELGKVSSNNRARFLRCCLTGTTV